MISHYWSQGITLTEAVVCLESLYPSDKYSYSHYSYPNGQQHEIKLSPLDEAASAHNFVVALVVEPDMTCYYDWEFSPKNRSSHREAEPRFYWGCSGVRPRPERLAEFPDLHPGGEGTYRRSIPNCYQHALAYYNFAKQIFLQLGVDETRGYSSTRGLPEGDQEQDCFGHRLTGLFFNRISLSQKVILPFEEGREATTEEIKNYDWSAWWPTYKVFPELSPLRPLPPSQYMSKPYPKNETPTISQEVHPRH